MGKTGKREKRPFGFFKTTVLGALLVVVPVGIVSFALWHVAMLFKVLLGPIFTHLPFDSYTVRSCAIAAVLLSVVILCYFTGLLARTRWGRRLRDWAERTILDRIPGYKVVRSLAHQYLGHEDEDERKFLPVMVDLYASGTRAVGFEIEELGDGTVAVFLPSVPAVTLGQLQIVPRERVFPVEASLHETIETLTMFGEGAAKLVAAK